MFFKVAPTNKGGRFTNGHLVASFIVLFKTRLKRTKKQEKYWYPNNGRDGRTYINLLTLP